MQRWLLLLTLSVLCPASLWAGPDEDFWRNFRTRQRKELASLPVPSIPVGKGNPVDRFLLAHWKRHKVEPPDQVDDRTFCIRVHLDVIGLRPTPEQLDNFLRDKRPDKRAHLVDALLADRKGYAEHWMTFWGDLLRNDEQTNIDGLRQPITRWLYPSLLENKPLDRFTAELLHPGRTGPVGYLKGVNWRGRVNASQTPPIQAAQNVAQVFLASLLKCASCHDSFVNERSLEDAYGLASFFSPSNLEMHRCDKGTGKKIPPQFLFPKLGSISPKANLATRHRTVAHLVTRPSNPRFARALVNRYWQRLLGRGLIEPVDDFDTTTMTSPLLDWLAHDLSKHDYNAKHTIRRILLSRIYQAPMVSTKVKRNRESPLLGPRERRLTSEQYLDAISQATGYWPRTAVMRVKVANPRIRAWRIRKPGELATALGRPNREQVCTQRNHESTVLQALELVNGKELASRLAGGAKTLLSSNLGKEKDPAQVVRILYLRTFCREPNEKELVLCQPLIGKPTMKTAQRQQGWEDVLWVLVMHPEFQFIH